MLRIVCAAVLISSFSCSQPKDVTCTKEALIYQQELAATFLDENNTPLHPEERANFKGLAFFPIDEAFCVIAQFQPIDKGKTIAMTTSRNEEKFYKEYGLLKFQLHGQDLQLTVYQPDPILEKAPNHLFIPFKDASNGTTTYGAGRYLDLEIDDINKDHTVQLNFNKAYHPYCAYSVHYNCPYPPATNHLKVAIEVGERYNQ